MATDNGAEPSKITAIIATLTNDAGLQSLVVGLMRLGFEGIIMVDNRPYKKKVQLYSHQKGIVYLPQPRNRGFAAAVNLGAKTATTEWLLILNDDVEGITDQAVGQLIGTAEKNGWSAISPVLIDPAGKIENIGYRVLPIGKVKLNFDPAKNSDNDLDGLTAACLLIKREAFEKLDGFDEDFFAYLEDVDLFLRLKKAGYHFGVDTDITVRHHHMKTTEKIKGFKEKQDLINWWRLILKHWTLKRWLENFFPIMIERGRNLSGYLKTR